MTDRDQQTDDAYQIAVLTPQCINGQHQHCAGYCECGCHR